VLGRDNRYFAQRGFGSYGSTGEHICELAEEPRPTQTSATNDDTGTTSLFHHQDRILSGPNIAVAENGNIRNCFNERGDRVPVGTPRVALFGRS